MSGKTIGKTNELASWESKMVRQTWEKPERGYQAQRDGKTVSASSQMRSKQDAR